MEPSLQALHKEEIRWHNVHKSYSLFLATMQGNNNVEGINANMQRTTTLTTLMQYRMPLQELNNLPAFLLSARNSFKANRIPSTPSSQPELPLVLPNNADIACHLLSSICRQRSTQRNDNMFLNFETAAFHLNYLLQVQGHEDLPKSRQELHEVLMQSADFVVSDPRRMDGAKNLEIAELKAPLSLAFAVSPLLLFAGRNLQSRPPGRDTLFDYWQILGKYEHPEPVLLVEKEGWDIVFDIALGADPDTRLDQGFKTLCLILYNKPWSFTDIPTIGIQSTMPASPQETTRLTDLEQPISGKDFSKNIKDWPSLPFQGLILSAQNSDASATASFTDPTAQVGAPLPHPNTQPRWLATDPPFDNPPPRPTAEPHSLLRDAPTEPDLSLGTHPGKSVQSTPFNLLCVAPEANSPPHTTPLETPLVNPDARLSLPHINTLQTPSHEQPTSPRSQPTITTPTSHVVVDGPPVIDRLPPPSTSNSHTSPAAASPEPMESAAPTPSIDINDVNPPPKPSGGGAPRPPRKCRKKNIESDEDRSAGIEPEVPKAEEESAEEEDLTEAPDTQPEDMDLPRVAPLIVTKRLNLIQKEVIDLTQDSTDEEKEEKKIGVPNLVLYGGSTEQRLRSLLPMPFFLQDTSEDLRPVAHYLHDLEFIEELNAAARILPQNKSQICQIPYNIYITMSPKQLMEIFRRQHILVTECPCNKQDPMSFKESVETLGPSLWSTITVQDQSRELPDSDDKPQDQTSAKHNRRGQLAHTGVTHANEVAWERFDGKQGDHYPTSDMQWLLVSTGWTQHRWHEDSNGFATFIRVKTGIKWWYMGKPKADLPASHRSGGIQRLLDGFDLDACNSDRLDIEVAVVDIQDMLFMQPNTLHVVITPKPSVIKGGHFFTIATDSLARDAGHVLDVSSFEQLVDLFCFCNVFEVFNMLSEWEYLDEFSVESVKARRHAINHRKHAREIKEWFFCNYHLTLNGEALPLEKARLSFDQVFLAHQCKALCHFKHQAFRPQKDVVTGQFKVAREKVYEALRNCLHETTANPIYTCAEIDPQCFYTFDYHGPLFGVERRTKPITMKTDIDGYTWDDRDFFTRQSGRHKAHTEVADGSSSYTLLKRKTEVVTASEVAEKPPTGEEEKNLINK
ncbi:hypothetical protein DXG01_002501 [Tephrocybe rancida]|nr:hypothetical protein DXG01_002501 [Tephrocybe rancida]